VTGILVAEYQSKFLRVLEISPPLAAARPFGRLAKWKRRWHSKPIIQENISQGEEWGECGKK